MTNSLEVRVGSLTLPPLIKRRALKALRWLVGEAKDEESGHSIEPHTKLGILHARAEARIATDFVRGQANREAVAAITVEELAIDRDEEEGPQHIEEDWLNVFGKYAENASSEMLRNMWGKILAGEIRKPSSFSLSTLRLVAELDQRIASTFEKYVGERFGEDQFIIKPAELKGEVLLDLIFLEEIGLVQQVAGVGGLSLTQTTNAEGQWVLTHGDYLLLCQGQVNYSFDIAVIKITRIGREIARILLLDGVSSLRAIGHAVKDRFDSVNLNLIIERLPSGQIRYTPIENIKL